MSAPESLPLAEELARRGISPSRALGQNFMIDRQMLDFLVRSAGVAERDVILEIGTGAGFLTERLVTAASHVVSVEVDRGLYGLAGERLGETANLTLIHSDALQSGRRWSDCVRAAVDAALDSYPRAPLKLVANLPYCISTAVVRAVLCGKPAFSGAWFTCQWEVAERLTAVAGSRQYGFVSVLAALLADVRVIRKLPPTVFWPRPKVKSAIVEMVCDEEKRALFGGSSVVLEGMGKLFGHRRKSLRAILKGAGVDRGGILEVEKALRVIGLTDQARVSELDPSAILAVARAAFLETSGT